MTVLYPEITPYNQGYLKVDNIHEVYYEESGNREGYPIVFVHGGPGAGTDPSSRRYFDPQKYRIIVFDQRGCGQSKPYAELKNNTTWDLINDMEKIREHLNIEKWILFGGSWGVTLSLIYAINYYERVAGLILRGVWLSTNDEIDWYLRGGASKYFPEAWAEFIKPIDIDSEKDIVEQYYDIYTGDFPIDVKESACKSWSIWEASISKLHQSQDLIESFGDLKKAIAIATIECHYFINNMFGQSDNYIMENINRVAHIPAIVINGRYDTVCPNITAYNLVKEMNRAQYIICPESGHSASEKEIEAALIASTDTFMDNYNIQK